MGGIGDYIQFVLAPQVLTGLAFGVAVILVALGLTIIFGLLDVINMAHGEFYALGAFIALALGSGVVVTQVTDGDGLASLSGVMTGAAEPCVTTATALSGLSPCCMVTMTSPPPSKDQR